MTGGGLFREVEKVICRGACSGRNETDKTPETSSAQTQSDSQAENEYNGIERAVRHSIHIPTQQTTQQSDGIWSIGNLGGISNGPFQAAEQSSSLKDELEENERKARVDAVWNQINQGRPVKMPRTSMSKSTPERKATTQKTPDWMVALGLVPKKTSAIQETPGKRPAAVHNCTSEEARKAAAAALSAVREVTSASASTGKVE